MDDNTENWLFKSGIVGAIVQFVFIFLLIQIIFKKIEKRVAGNDIFQISFDKTKGSKKTSFDDVGGLHVPKEELKDIISFFHNQDQWNKYGAKRIKGVLMIGPPGNGKTLLARALAGECQVPFISCAASEFIGILVGLGVTKIKELFRKARSYPNGCIIFLDELDAIARKRTNFSSLSDAEQERTLIQLMFELDGFDNRSNEKVIVLAATNRYEILDPAVTRPGRFDRKIKIDYPTLKEREEIITICLRSIASELINISANEIKQIAISSHGMSGAQIANIFNEAIVLCIRERKKIDQELIFQVIDKTLLGYLEGKTQVSSKARNVCAYHEAGHTVVGVSLPSLIVERTVIASSGGSVGGHTTIRIGNIEELDTRLISKKQCLSQVTSMLGGRIAEEIIFGSENVTTGAHDDFENASRILRSMILKLGMSELGVLVLDEENMSEDTRKKVDKIHIKLLNQCYQKATQILKNKKKQMILLAQLLIKKGCFNNRADIYYICINNRDPDLLAIEKKRSE